MVNDEADGQGACGYDYDLLFGEIGPPKIILSTPVLYTSTGAQLYPLVSVFWRLKVTKAGGGKLGVSLGRRPPPRIAQLICIAMGVIGSVEGLTTSMLARWTGFGVVGSALLSVVVAMSLVTGRNGLFLFGFGR